MRKSFLAATAVALVVAATTAGAAFAGEATGNFGTTGKYTPIENYVAASICAFSGQNPERFLPTTSPDYEPGRTQSWGQIPKAERDAMPAAFHPGSSCNGHTGFLAGGGGGE